MKVELSIRQVQNGNFQGLATCSFNELLDRYRLGRLRPREVKKELSIREVQGVFFKLRLADRRKVELARCFRSPG